MKISLRDICYIAVALILSYAVVKFLGMRAVVHGASMESALQSGDNLIVEKVSYRLHDPKRFDIVVCPGISGAEGEKPDLYIKRVIGLPGETISIEDGKVEIDGQLLQDDIYGKEDLILDAGMLETPCTLGEDEYFLMGDNRNNSRDSRDPLLGPVKKSEFIGKVWVRIWPLSKFGSLP